MTDLLTNMLANRETRETLIEWLELSADLLKAIDAPPPDGKSPLALFKTKPEPEEDEDGEDDKKQDEPSEDAEKSA